MYESLLTLADGPSDEATKPALAAVPDAGAEEGSDTGSDSTDNPGSEYLVFPV
jgi:hypothetical protein